MKRLTDGDLEMLKTAVRAMVEYWQENDVAALAVFRNVQVVSWQALLDKLDEVTP